MDTAPIISDQVVVTMGGIIVAAITVLGSIQIAIINNTRQHAKATREQTENNHTLDPNKVSNLRENIDSNQSALNEKLDGIIDTQRRQTNKLDRLFAITNKQQTKIDENTADIEEIRKVKGLINVHTR